MEWLSTLNNPAIITAVLVPLILVLFLVDRFTRFDVMAPVKDCAALVGIVGLSVAAYLYGGWIGLGAVAFLIAIR